MLMERIYATGRVPRGTKWWKVRDILIILQAKFEEQMDRPLQWIAFASKAVCAGYQIAKKRKYQRQRTLQAINACRRYLHMGEIIPPDGWDEHNLIYGYDSARQFQKKTGWDMDTICLWTVLKKTYG